MRFDVISLFPELVNTVLAYGMPARAIASGALALYHWNPRDFTVDRHRTVDDRPYGGGPGMVMKYEPLRDCVQAIEQQLGSRPKIAVLSPQGKKLTQAAVVKLATRQNMILVAGRYEGIDERFIQSFADEEWSLGDYILSGGELAVMVLIDAIARLLPGVLGAAESAAQDSFGEDLLDWPHFTRPEIVDKQTVPAVLLSGDHAKIARWRRLQALGRTWQRRPDLLAKHVLTEKDQQLLQEYILANQRE